MTLFYLDKFTLEIFAIDDSEFGSSQTIFHHSGQRATAGFAIRKDNCFASEDEAIERVVRECDSQIKNNQELAIQHLNSANHWAKTLRRVSINSKLKRTRY